MKRRQLSKHDQAKTHPIAKAIAISNMTKQVRQIRTRVLGMLDGDDAVQLLTALGMLDGDDAVQLLTALGWLVGIGAEIANATNPGSPAARRLHGAVRQIVQMSAAGGRWDSQMANSLYDAAVDSQTLMLRHPDIGLVMTPGANHLSRLIQTGQATLDSVAGAELYQPEPAGTPL